MPRRRPPVRPPCEPAGSLTRWAERRRVCVVPGCETVVHPVPTASGLDWLWAGPDGMFTGLDFPAALWTPEQWDALAATDAAEYSRLKAALSLRGSGFHEHVAGELAPGWEGLERPDPPRCCGQWMHAAPAGWRCRVSGEVFAYAVPAAA